MDSRQADQALAALSGRRTGWARLPIQDKIRYLKQIRRLALTHAQRWADAETKAKQLTPGSPLIGAEAWIAGPCGVISWLTASIQTLITLDADDDLIAHVKTRCSVDGKLIARVLPADTYKRLLFHGVTAEV